MKKAVPSHQLTPNKALSSELEFLGNTYLLSLESSEKNTEQHQQNLDVVFETIRSRVEEVLNSNWKQIVSYIMSLLHQYEELNQLLHHFLTWKVNNREYTLHPFTFITALVYQKLCEGMNVSPKYIEECCTDTIDSIFKNNKELTPERCLEEYCTRSHHAIKALESMLLAKGFIKKRKRIDAQFKNIQPCVSIHQEQNTLFWFEEFLVGYLENIDDQQQEILIENTSLPYKVIKPISPEIEELIEEDFSIYDEKIPVIPRIEISDKEDLKKIDEAYQKHMIGPKAQKKFEKNVVELSLWELQQLFVKGGFINEIYKGPERFAAVVKDEQADGDLCAFLHFESGDSIRKYFKDITCVHPAFEVLLERLSQGDFIEHTIFMDLFINRKKCDQLGYSQVGRTLLQQSYQQLIGLQIHHLMGIQAVSNGIAGLPFEMYGHIITSLINSSHLLWYGRYDKNYSHSYRQSLLKPSTHASKYGLSLPNQELLIQDHVPKRLLAVA